MHVRVLTFCREIFRNNACRAVSSFTVPERAYLEVRGKDTKTFLQGVATNDMELLASFGDCIATAFLTPKGRVLSDAIVYDLTRDKDGKKGIPSVLIETHTSTHEDLARFLSMYRLRAKLKIRTVLNYRTVIAYGNSDSAPGDSIFSVVDPRHHSLGHRMIYETEVSESTEDDSEEADKTVVNKDASMYSRYRMVHGIPEGLELVGRVPLEANLDLLGYISFKKGCYVGQELIARTKHKGLVRKRLLPFIRTLQPAVGTELAPLEPAVVQSILKTTAAAAAPATTERLRIGSEIKLADNSDTVVGEVVAVSIAQDMGIAKMTLKNAMGDSKNMTIEGEGGHAFPVEVFTPQWWPQTDPVTNKSLNDPSTF
jgi:folate-binding protein YgfZ